MINKTIKKQNDKKIHKINLELEIFNPSSKFEDFKEK
jgi:hypothetical protein